MFETKPLRAASYIPTPERYKNAKCGLINIQNPDQECFKWNALYHQTPKGKNDDRLSVLKKVVDKYKWDDINFPASYEDISRFEELNQMCVFVYGLDDENNIHCQKKGNSKYILNDCMYLLRVEEEDQAHYIYIKHLDRLFNAHQHVVDKDKRLCPICTKKIHINDYKSQLSQCYKFEKDGTLISLPEKGFKDTMEFYNYKNKLERPYIVYGDFECSNCPTGDKERITCHKPNSACFYFVCTYDSSQNYLWHSVGENCVIEMILELDKLAQKCIKNMKNNTEMILSKEDKSKFYNAKCCHICNKAFQLKDKRVRDHDHRTGEFRGAAHDKCNINYYSNRYLPIVFHNLRGYDSHLILKSAYDISEQLTRTNFSVIPNSNEKFMSFSINDCRFIDSMQFMSSSLEKLVENLYDPEARYKHFKYLKEYFPDDLDLLCRKGFYPYEWVDNINKLDHEGLPPIESFYSQLKQEGLEEKDYEHVKNVYDKMNCTTVTDDHLTVMFYCWPMFLKI